MKTQNGVTVNYHSSNAAYDIYKVTGVETQEENGEPIYHEELRNMGSDEAYVLSQYCD